MNASYQTGIFYQGRWMNQTEFRAAKKQRIARIISLTIGLLIGFFAAGIWRGL